MKIKNSAVPAVGFTLIEVLVVVAVISVLSLIVVYSMSTGNPSQQLKREGLRLSAVIELAIDESIFRSKEIGLEVLTDGYRFLIWERPSADGLSQSQSEANLLEDEEDETSAGTQVSLADGESVQNVEEESPKWADIGGDRIFRQYELPAGIRAYLEVEEGEIDLFSTADKLEQEGTGDGSEDNSLNESGLGEDDSGEDKDEVLPNIVFMSSGEVTPFHLEVYLEDNSDLKFTIDVNQIGQVTVTRPGEEDGF